jgi:hypothetical protein
MTITNQQILKVLHVFSWIIFIGLSIETGGIIFNTIYAMYNPVVARHFWNGADLSAVYEADKVRFLTQAFFMTIVAMFKATIFWLIIKLFQDKKFNLARPFSSGATSVVFNISYLCLGAGIFSIWGSKHIEWLQGQGIVMPNADILHISGGDVWLFMAIVLFVIGQVFRKGAELQTENDFTV